MKILYAAGNRKGSFRQLRRFLDSIKNKKLDVQIAAYSKSMGNLDIDYNLDCLLNFTNPDGNITYNENYVFYYNEIKRFDPDLIISDIEVFTSMIGLELNKKVWQVSPVLLYYALDFDAKYRSGIRKNYAYLFNRTFTKKSHINFVVNNSDRRFVYSHLCDINEAPKLPDKYEWIRPEFLLMDEYVTTVNDGTELLLADAFYNQAFCASKIDPNDVEAVICSNMNYQFGLGSFDTNDKDRPVVITINDDVKFLSEVI